MQVAQLFAAREQAAWVDSAGADAPTSNAPAAPRGVIPLQLPDSDDDRAAAQRRGRSVLSAGSSREYGRADPSDAWRAIAGLDRADGGEKSPRRSPRGRATARQVGQVGLSPRGRPAANMFKRTRGASPREERDEWPASVGASDGAGAGTGMISPRSPAGPKAPLASPPVTPGRGFPSPRTAGALPKSASASASSSGRNRRRDAGLLSPRGNGGELSETRPWRRVDGTGESRFSEERGDAREGESSASSTPRGGVAARRRVPYSLSSPAAVSPPVSPATVLPSPSSDRVAQPLSPVLLPLSALRALRAVCPHCAAELAVAVQIGADGAATLGVEAAAPWEGGGLYDPPPLTPPWRRQPRLRQQAAGKQEELRAENIASPRPRVAGQSASGGVVTKSKAESAKARHRRIHSAIEGLVVDGLAEDGTAEKGTAAEGVAGAVEVDGGEGTSSGPRDAEEGDGGKTSGEDGEGERERAREGTRGLLESMSEGDLSQGGGGSGGESKESAAEADGRGGGVESDGNFGAEGGRGGRRAERGGRRIPLSPALGARRGEPSGQRGGGGQVRRAASPLSIAVGGEGQGQQEEEEGGGGTPNSGGSKAHRRFTTWDGGSSVSAGASMAPWEFVLRRAYRDVGEWFDVREQQLGVGQFGVIRACVRRTTGVTFACKTIRKDCVLTAEDAEDVRKEVAMMQLLKAHPNIIEINRTFEDDRHVHIVMEICRGGDLFDRIKKGGRLSERGAATVLQQLLAALAFCHGQGVVHRDVKPENILLVAPDSLAKGATGSGAPGEEGSRGGGGSRGVEIRLIDFGMSARFQPGEPLSELIGTPYYMAPEVLAGAYGPEADVWSAGVVLFVMVAGYPPFWAGSNDGIFDAIRTKDVPFRAAKWQGVSEACKDVVRGLLHKDPRYRLTLGQALEHPWIRENATTSSPQ